MKDETTNYDLCVAAIERRLNMSLSEIQYTPLSEFHTCTDKCHHEVERKKEVAESYEKLGETL